MSNRRIVLEAVGERGWSQCSTDRNSQKKNSSLEPKPRVPNTPKFD